MNAKMFRKTAFYLMFITAITLLVCCFGLSASAANCAHDNLNDFSWEVVLQPTCGNQGIMQQECPDCGETVTDYIKPDNNAHVAGQWTTEVLHTCSSEGRDVRKCIYCSMVMETRTVPAHDYSVTYKVAATCTRSGYEMVTCQTCFNTYATILEIDKNAHAYGEWQIITEATCKEGVGERARFCKNTTYEGEACKAKQTENYVDAHNHTDITWFEAETVAPDCTKDGYTPGICNDCNEEVKKILPQHSASKYTVLTSTPATCHESGVERRLCECGYEYDFELLPDENSPHELGEWKISKLPDCTDGVRERHCKYHYKDGYETQTIPATGEHTYGEWVVTKEPGCTYSGKQVKTCTTCGHEVAEAIPARHMYTEWTTVIEMSCKEGAIKSGLKTATCEECGYTKNFPVPAIHTYGSWIIVERADCKTGNPGIKERTCTNAGCNHKETTTYTVEHDYTEWFVTTAPICATATTAGREGIRTRWCQTCRTKETEKIPATHVYGERLILGYYYPCNTNLNDTSLEYNAISYCEFCNKEKQERVAFEHVYGEWTVTEGNCATGAYTTKTRSCTVCNGAKVTERVPAEHKLTAWEFEGNCENGITKKTRRCTVEACNYVEEVEGEDIAAHPNMRTTTVEPTCVTSGHTEYYCPDCQYSRIGDIKPAKGHSLSEQWHTLKPASCVSAGSKYKDCSVCDYIEYVKIPGTSHVLIATEVAIEPTCSTGGWSAESYCAVCKQMFQSQPVPALGHEFENGACIRCRAYQGTVDPDDLTSPGCVCSCHSTDSLDTLVFSIIKKIYQLFGINQNCACGVLHYEEVGFIGQLLGRGQTEEK